MLWEMEDEIMQETFLFNGNIAYLYLFEEEIVIKSEGRVIALLLDLDLAFDMERTTKGDIVGLLLYSTNRQYHLRKSQWADADRWEATLMKYIPHNNFHDHFQPIKKLGMGGFANVYLSSLKIGPQMGRQYAIKAFKKETISEGDGVQSLYNQIKVMRSFQSSNVAEFIGLYQSGNSYYICMEYVPGTTLANYLKTNCNLTVEMRKKLLSGLLTAVRDMQGQGIIHRDIKPENIMVDSTLDRVKLVDFGLATLINQPKYLFVRCGTPGYVAPEIIRLSPRTAKTSRLRIESDLFSVGAVYFLALYGQPLFQAQTSSEATIKNKECKIKFPIKADLKDHELQLLASLLKINPDDRITAISALEHPFFINPHPVSFRIRKLSLDSNKTNDSLGYDWF